MVSYHEKGKFLTSDLSIVHTDCSLQGITVHASLVQQLQVSLVQFDVPSTYTPNRTVSAVTVNLTNLQSSSACLQSFCFVV